VIYLDYNATTPLLPEVWTAMQPYFTSRWGNPSSAYRFGAQLKNDIEAARESVATLIGADGTEITFTSCATESNNTAMTAALQARPEKRHIVTSAVEHSAVLNFCKTAEKRGYQVTYLGVDTEGRLNLSELEAAITDNTALVSLMWANNETGVLFPVEAIAQICQDKGVLFHCDAVQAVGKIPVDVSQVEADYLTISAHKIYGPKGIGGLYVKKSAPFEPMLVGGHQEDGRRGGTENVGLIVGFGLAATAAEREIESRREQVSARRDQLEAELLEKIPGARVNGARDLRIPNTTNLWFTGIDSVALVAYLDGQDVCVSSGSACLAQSITPSHVILAMANSFERAKQSLRFSLSHQTSDLEIIASVEKVTLGIRLLN
jgi:cysteine desulfurase